MYCMGIFGFLLNMGTVELPGIADEGTDLSDS